MVKDKCYQEAKEKYAVFPSGYASGYIAKCRKKKGIVIKSKKGLKLKQWNEEKWTDEKGNACGSKDNKNVKKCRPSKRVNKSTPVTWNEMSKNTKAKAIREKKKVGMGKRTSPIKRSPKGIKLEVGILNKRSPKGVLNVAPSDFKEKKPLYKPYKSTRSGKKGMVYVKNDNGNKKLIHFGDANMSDYTKHHDKNRRKNYLTRSAGIKDKSGNLTKDNKNSANYWSRKINW